MGQVPLRRQSAPRAQHVTGLFAFDTRRGALSAHMLLHLGYRVQLAMLSVVDHPAYAVFPQLRFQFHIFGLALLQLDRLDAVTLALLLWQSVRCGRCHGHAPSVLVDRGGVLRECAIQAPREAMVPLRVFEGWRLDGLERVGELFPLVVNKLDPRWMGPQPGVALVDKALRELHLGRANEVWPPSFEIIQLLPRRLEGVELRIDRSEYDLVRRH